MSTVNLTSADVTVKLNELRKKPFCQDKHWNTQNRNTADLDSVSEYACGTNGYMCNEYKLGYQCFAFANYLADTIIGSRPECSSNPSESNGGKVGNWELYTGKHCENISIEPGDIIRIPTNEGGHSAMVWRTYPKENSSSNIVEVAEVLGSEGCAINWGVINKNSNPDYATDDYIKSHSVFIAKPPLGKLFPPTGYNVEITFDACGGTCSTTSKTVTLGGKYGTLPVPTKAGYTFAGWWDEEYIEYDEYTANTTVTDCSIKTLYAHWAKIYKITNVATETCLNVYGDNVTSLSNGVNVTLWPDSGTNEQKWVIAGTQRRRYIRSAIDTTYGLNVYRSGTPFNCNVHKIIGNETDARIDMVKRTKYGYYRIKLTEYDLYLTADSTHGNVYWDEETGTDNQNWYIAEV